MRAMATALPNLQEITLRHFLEFGHRFVDGEDPDESVAARTANETIHDINIITNFRKLRELHVVCPALSMNGRYPLLFNFPLLQKFTMFGCFNLKWDLSMLEGLPLLKELHCFNNTFLTGNINSLRVLKDTLEKVIIDLSPDVEGNFYDLADFPSLVKLELSLTSVSGDIRKIGEKDFLKLEHLALPDTVYGGREYEFHRISDVPEVMHSIHHLRKRVLGFAEGWTWSLSELSPDFYHFDNPRATDLDDVPFFVAMVQVGSRLGWRWENDASDQHCEMNWLDPEPEKESSDHEEYTLKLQAMQEKIDLYRGFQQPPTEAEYNRIQNLRGLF